jgi:heptosyltransferase-2
VIKLGATGDVLRTTPLLPALRRAHAGAHLTWVTRPGTLELLSGLDGIDRLLPLDTDALAHLPAERFDLVLCLDKEPAASGLASRVQATEKRGFLLGSDGTLRPAHPDSDFAYQLGMDDELKFRRNQKTYQQIAFEMAGLSFRGEDYQLALGEADRAHARAAFSTLGAADDEPLIGLNVGAGEAFANKAWRIDGWAELAGLVAERLGLRCVLLGGAADRARMDAVAARATVPLLDPGVTDSLCRFAAVAERCRAVVSGDTLGLHLALALRRRVVAIFGSTCPQEIELYGRGEKLVPKIDCHPCYRRQCDIDPSCSDAVSSGAVFDALERVLDGAA